MKKILFTFIITLCLCLVIVGSDLTGVSPSSTYQKLFSLDGDSLTTSLDGVTDGVGNAMPFEISQSALEMKDTYKLQFNSSNHYIYGKTSNVLELLGKTDLLLNAGSNIKFFGDSAYIDATNHDYTSDGDISCTDGTFAGDVSITGSDDPALNVENNVEIGGTLEVTGTSTFTGAITANGGVAGDLTSTGTVTCSTVECTTATVSGASTFASTVNIADKLTCTKASGTGLEVTDDATVGGELTVTGTSTFTGATTHSAGVKAGAITEISEGAGTTVEGVKFIDSDIQLNGSSNYISFDADDNTKMLSSADNTLEIHVDNSKDITITSDKVQLETGTSLTVDGIAETTGNAGVTLEGSKFENMDNIYNITAPSGKYVSFTDSDDDSDPSSHSFSASKDVYIQGKFEVDGLSYFDTNVDVSGSVTAESIIFDAATPTLSPSEVDGASGRDFYIHGGEAIDTGGDLYLDGGDASADGDVILGDSYGNVSINSLVLYPDYTDLTCDGGGVTDEAKTVISYIAATSADTITVSNGVEGQVKKLVMQTNGSAYDISVTASNQGFTTFILDAMNECAEIVYHDNKWYVISLNN